MAQHETALHHRIAVGLDESEPARHALLWAVREAARERATVLVVTAWLPGPPWTTRPESGWLMAERLRLMQMQHDRIAEAVDGLADPPVIARQIILADPVTALSHAAAMADLVVVGGEQPDGSAVSVAAAVARRLAGRRRSRCPVVAVTAPTPQASAPLSPIG